MRFCNEVLKSILIWLQENWTDQIQSVLKSMVRYGSLFFQISTQFSQDFCFRLQNIFFFTEIWQVQIEQFTISETNQRRAV